MTNDFQERNKKIIEEVIKKIERTCPNAVDMVAIDGSFASGDYHEKSDLDLLIIKNSDEADEISTSFILDDIGYDIYTHSWDDLKKISRYENPYVAKLKQLDIIYTRNNGVNEKYKELQADLNDNMNNEELIKKNISKNFSKILDNYNDILNCENISNAYKILGSFMYNLENVLYLLNGKYVEHGTKNIPVEIAKMNNVPRDVVNIYLKLPECSSINEIIDKMFEIEKSLETFLKDKGIKVDFNEEEKEKKEKKELKSEDLTGSFEELYSNYYNKLKKASDDNNRYLSFRTMIDAQGFYDEYSDNFDIEPIDLIGKYNPNNLEENHKSFVSSLQIWKNLYDSFYKNINIIDNIKDLYDNKRLFVAYQTDYETNFFNKLNQEDNNAVYVKGSNRIL